MDSDDSSCSSDSEIEDLADTVFNKIKNNLNTHRLSDSECESETTERITKDETERKSDIERDDEDENEDNDDDDDEEEESGSDEDTAECKLVKPHNNVIILSSSIQSNPVLNENYLTKPVKQATQKSKKLDIQQIIKGSNDDKELMRKSVLKPDLERNDVLPPYQESLRQLKKQRKKEKQMTKGKGWYNMSAPEMTDETKNDLTVLQMRRSLDPKRFYKNNDLKSLPKFFQFGTVIESPVDYYHARIPKKQRKSTMVDELLADAEFRKYNKRKYVEIQEAKWKGAGPYKHMKRLKKKKR